MTHTVQKPEWQMLTSSFEGYAKLKAQKDETLLRFVFALLKEDVVALRQFLDQGFVVNQVLRKSRIANSTINRFLDRLGCPEGVTPLAIAAVNDQVPVLEFLLFEAYADPGLSFAPGYDAAWLANERGKQDAYLLLMNAGAAVDRRLPSTHETRLINAVKRSDLFTVRDLLSRRANVNLFDKDGRTALHHNFSKSPYAETDEQIGRLLLQYGGDPNAVDHHQVPAYAFLSDELQARLLTGFDLKAANTTEDILALIKHPHEAPEVAVELEDDLTPVKPAPGEPDIPQIKRTRNQSKMRPLI